MIQRSVLYVVNSSLASPTGGGRTRVISEAIQARIHGWQIITLCFVRPEQWLRPRFLYEGKAKLAMESNSKVLYVPRLPFTRFKLVNRLNTWFCGLMVFLLTRYFRTQLIHGQGIMPSLFALLATQRGNQDVAVIADIHGLLTEESLYRGGLSREDPLFKIYERYESLVINSADWLVFVSRGMQDYYEEKYATAFLNSSVIPCATDSKFTIDLERRAKLRQDLGLEDELVFCYVGSATSYQLIDVMCELFYNLSNEFPDVNFLIFSHHREAFLKALNAAGVPPLAFKLEAVNHDQIFEKLQLGDIGFLLRDASPVNRVASPTKFAEYCLCGLPVITTPYVGDISELVGQHGIGTVIDPNETSVDHELRQFVDDVQTRRQLYAEKCSRFAKEFFSWDSFGQNLVSIYEAQLPNP